MKLHWQTTAPTQFNGPPFFPGTSYEPAFTSSVEQVQAVRPSRGNQQLNDELRMKADELEKLFAAHKLRVYGDRAASSWRSGPAGLQVGHVAGAVEKRPAEVPTEYLPEGNWVREGSSNDVDFDGNLLLKMVGNQNFMMQKLRNLTQTEDCRGKFYERYMQKRDAKLREEWGSKRVQKEANMKAMENSLEQTRAEMKAHFSGSADKQYFAERLRSFCVHSAIERKEQTVEYLQSEEEEDIQELSEQAQYGRDKSCNDTLFSHSSSATINSNKFLSTRNMSSTTQISIAPISRPPVKDTNSGWQQRVKSLQSEEEEDLQDSYKQVQYRRNKSYNGATYSVGSSRIIDSKKLLSSRSVSSSATQTSVAPIPRPTVKTTSSGHVRRRSQTENLLGRAVSNYDDFRKENTKPSNGISKATTNSQSRNLPRSKSIGAKIKIFKEDKLQSSEPLRKSSANPDELKDLSPLNPNSVNLTPLRFSKEQSEQAIFDKIQRIGESKQFLRKGNGIGPGAGAGVAKRKASMASEILKNGEETESLVDRREDSLNMVNDEDDDFERTPAGGRPIDFHTDSDSEGLTSSQGSRKSGDPLSEYGDVVRSPSEGNIDPIGNVQELAGESPRSMNSHIRHSFSYVHGASNTDTPVDSPTGSPAAWNLHPLKQMREADAVRIRKKWGRAQNPFSVSTASRQSPKDVTKGLKRLLNFGKKSRGVESIVTDWVSTSTTSEADDDTEDVNDQEKQSSVDPRMSRMGYPLPAHDGFNAGKIFPEQAPSSPNSIRAPPASFESREDHQSGNSLKVSRSFLSLPSFRNRGSESKLR